MDEKYEIGAELKTVWLGRRAEYFSIVSSTADLCYELAEKGAPSGTVVIAERQTEGKGRNGSRWQESVNALHFAVLLRTDCPAKKALSLAPVTLVGLSRGLLYYPGLAFSIDWPNDFFADERKFGAILTEMNVENGFAHDAVISVNLNISSAGLPGDLQAFSCGMEDVLGCAVDKKELLCRLLLGLESAYDQFLNGQTAQLFEEWRDRARCVGKTVTIATSDGQLQGEVIGLSDDGFLLLDLGRGKAAKIISGKILS